MRRYLLDTNLFVAVLMGRTNAVALAEPWYRRREVATSVMVVAETLEYIKPMRNHVSLRRSLGRLIGETHPYPLINPTLERYADIRLQHRPPNGPGLIGDIDILIAVTAQERRLSVVTTDAHFLRVPNLGVMLLDRSTLQVMSHRPATR